MGNRNIQAKMLKIKRQGRFAVFSGETAKYAVRHEQVLVHEGDEKTTVKSIEIAVGKISLSKAVMSTGRGPDAERMAEYYARVKPESFQEPLPEGHKSLHHKDAVWRHTQPERKHQHIFLARDEVAGTLELCWEGSDYFLVETDYIKRIVRRSRTYNSKKTAMDRLKADRIAWVAEIPMQ